MEDPAGEGPWEEGCALGCEDVGEGVETCCRDRVGCRRGI